MPDFRFLWKKRGKMPMRGAVWPSTAHRVSLAAVDQNVAGNMASTNTLDIKGVLYHTLQLGGGRITCHG